MHGNRSVYYVDLGRLQNIGRITITDLNAAGAVGAASIVVCIGWTWV